MMPWRMLLDKSVQTIKTSGTRVFIRKTIAYIRKTIKREDNSDAPGKVFMDVLFINGCFLPHPSRYRVSHQREQLLANGVSSNEVFYENVTLDLVKHYRLFIFFRCPYTDTIGQFISLARELHKTVLFDVDDLVIDRKYTNQIKYIQSMPKEEKRGYDEGVQRMQRTLSLCDGAITTTGRLAEELKNYVPEVFINRNVASDRMLELSERAAYDRDVRPYLSPKNVKTRRDRKRIAALNDRAKEKERSGEVIIGYFSGSITHNDDIDLILPVLVRLLEKYENLKISFVGELDLPEELEPFRARIKAMPFVSWQKLPELVASVDINIAPLEDTIFNEAKSENKWTEAALVKVPTVASRIGAFQDMVEDGVTGLLCDTQEEWFEAISTLIEQPALRKKLGAQAYQKAFRSACTLYTGRPLADYLRSRMKPNLVMVLPSVQISGGMLVGLKHCQMLMDAGIDVTVFNDDFGEKDLTYEGYHIPVISTKQTQIHARINKAVATLWSTVNFLELYPNIDQRYYLVQNFEPNFYKAGTFFRFSANQTYLAPVQLNYITISRWCKSWLESQYAKVAKYAPNGINLSRFKCQKRNLDKQRIRILVEGNSEDYYKNVDESFQVVNRLDPQRYEIWYMSYQGHPKPWYRVDKFLHQIPNEKVGEIYGQCDILLKSSILESFSYPPLEMMATGGYVVVVPNDGNAEYLYDGDNCLFYNQGDIDSALKAIERLILDDVLQQRLFENGRRTAESRDWNKAKTAILDLYDLQEGTDYD